MARKQNKNNNSNNSYLKIDISNQSGVRIEFIAWSCVDGRNTTVKRAIDRETSALLANHNTLLDRPRVAFDGGYIDADKRDADIAIENMRYGAESARYAIACKILSDRIKSANESFYKDSNGQPIKRPVLALANTIANRETTRDAKIDAIADTLAVNKSVASVIYDRIIGVRSAGYKGKAGVTSRKVKDNETIITGYHDGIYQSVVTVKNGQRVVTVGDTSALAYTREYVSASTAYTAIMRLLANSYVHMFKKLAFDYPAYENVASIGAVCKAFALAEITDEDIDNYDDDLAE